MTRFDLEEQIMAAWTVVEDLKLLTESVIEHDMSKDRIANALVGLAEMQQLKFNKLFDTFETLIREGKL
jgi:hypothetical protein